MKAISILTDDSAFLQKTNEIILGQAKFQKLINAFNRLELFKIESINEVSLLAQDCTGFVERKLEAGIDPQPITILGLKFKTSKKAMVAMLELPDLSGLQELAEDCEESLSILKHLQLDDNKLTFTEIQKEKIREDFTLFAHNDQQLRFVEAAKKIAELINDLNQFIPYTCSEHGNKIIRFTEGKAQVNSAFFIENRRSFKPDNS